MEIAEDLIGIIHNAVLFAFFSKYAHELHIVVAQNFISIPVFLPVLLFEPREIPVKRRVEIFPITLAQSDSDVKTNNAFNPGFKAVIQNAAQVFLRIIDEGQKRSQPYYRRDPVIPKLL